jgi:hypothetical protein
METQIRYLIQQIQEKREKGINDQATFEAFKNDLKLIIKTDTLSARGSLVRILRFETDVGKLIDPSKGDRDINIWRWSWATLLELGLFFDADRVIEECYLCLLRVQSKNKKRYHKGTPLQTRAEGLSRVGFTTRARRFVILAYIEDWITGQMAAPAELTLKSAGISDEDLQLIATETTRIKAEKAAKGEELFYPEEVYEQIHFRIDFANVDEINKNLVFTNVEYLNELMRRVNEAVEGNDNAFKRKTLESLAQYLFSSVEGLFVQPSTRTSTYELDGIITNTANNPFLKTLDTYIPIECKNWKEPIGSPEITQFIAKLSLYKCNIGVLISRSGMKEGTVNELRKDAYRRLGIYVLVFDEDDIKSILGGKDIISIMIEKYKELKFSIHI